MKKLLVVLLVMALVFSLGACAKAEEPVKGQEEAQQADEAVAAEEPMEAKTFAIIYPIIHPFFADTSRAAEITGEELGVEVIIKGPETFDVQKQIEIVENLISLGVDGFGIGATDAEALKPLIDEAMDSGIKVVCFDTDAASSKRLSYIGTDNFNAGKHMGEVLAEYLGGEGTVLVSQGVPSQSNLMQRLEGVKETLKAYPGIEIIDEQSGQGDPQKTLANIEDMVSAHPDFDALLGIDAAAGPAAVTVWKAAGLEQPVIVFDDLPEILDGIRGGQITASIAQNQYVWGELIIKRLDEACEGKEIPAVEDTGTTVITKENVETYNK